VSTFNLLSGSVGQGGNNRAADVRVVQRLLNDWLVKERQPLLKVDGLAGAKTIAAITLFQKRHTSIADGRVDTRGPTITLLFNKHLSGLVDMFDLSHIARHVDAAAVKNALFSGADMSSAIQNYADALRKSA
jgi:peptidoglycan hydrolase-like protein with peptidoglycan-binding domain